MQQQLLTIGVPTYNRAAKLTRLLNAIQEEIAASNLEKEVCVLVSDNASTDQTPEVAREFMKADFDVAYNRHPVNVELDGNLRSLYTLATTPYIWFMADDDLPLKGAIRKLVDALREYSPDVLLSSFNQPPGSTVRQFNYPEPVRLVSDPVSAIEHIFRYTKVSIFVLRKVDFDDSQWRVLDGNLGDGWYYISLALSVLEASASLRLAAVSEPLATCDDDYIVIAYTPTPLLYMEKAAHHPFILHHSPNLVKFYHDYGYYQAIQFSFAAKSGGLLPAHPQEYDEFIANLDWRILALLRHPRSLFQFAALKLHIASLWSDARPFVRWIRQIASGRH